MAKETIYYREKKYKHDQYGNPRRALLYYKKEKDGLYLDDISTHQYWSSAGNEARKKYPNAKLESIYEGLDYDTYTSAERIEKQKQKQKKEGIK